MVRSSTPSRWLTIPHCIGDVARNAAPHDFVTLSGLLKAFSLQLELKILAIYEVVAGPAPVASVWCGGNAANGYPLKSLGEGRRLFCLIFRAA